MLGETDPLIDSLIPQIWCSQWAEYQLHTSGQRSKKFLVIYISILTYFGGSWSLGPLYNFCQHVIWLKSIPEME